MLCVNQHCAVSHVALIVSCVDIIPVGWFHHPHSRNLKPSV